MAKIERLNSSASRVELDHRARAARLELERTEQLLVSALSARSSWLRRALFRGFGIFTVLERRQRDREAAEPDGGAAINMLYAAGRPGLIPLAENEVISDLSDRVKLALPASETETRAPGPGDVAGRVVRPGVKSARPRRLRPHKPRPLLPSTCHSAAKSGCAPHGPRGSAAPTASHCRRHPVRPRRGRSDPGRREAAFAPVSRLRPGSARPQVQQRAVWAWEQTAPRPPGVLYGHARDRSGTTIRSIWRGEMRDD
jgi:hypothetical protein